MTGLSAHPCLTSSNWSQGGQAVVVRGGLDLNGDEPYSFHGRALPVGLFSLLPMASGFPAIFFPAAHGTITGQSQKESPSNPISW